ncbi:hypothetical protein ACN1S6_003700, partial [Vibrio cholerae]
NPQVAGSSPAGGATFRNPVYDWVLFYLSKVLSVESFIYRKFYLSKTAPRQLLFCRQKKGKRLSLP